MPNLDPEDLSSNNKQEIENNLINANNGSHASLADTSREVRMAVRRNRIEATRKLSKMKPNGEEGNIFLY